MSPTWKKPAHLQFFEAWTPTYLDHVEKGNVKEFWPEVTDKWFEKFPLEVPPADPTEKKTPEQLADDAKKKKINVSESWNSDYPCDLTLPQQIKRTFKDAQSGTAGRGNLHLDARRPRKRSDVDIYMSLFYDSRIRKTVLERWAVDKAVLGPESTVSVNIAEGELPLDSEDSSVLRDPKIMLSYKRMIATELWATEDEMTKEEVRSQRERDANEISKTVHNTEGEERLKLIRKYNK